MKPKRQSLPQQLPLLARQPILDEQLKVVGYELLCRPMPEDSSKWQTQFGDEATSEVLISTFNDLGIEIVTGGLPAHINYTKFWLNNPPPIPTKLVVVEILEYIQPTLENIEALKKLHAMGYTIALDDFLGDEAFEQFFPYAHIIKIDIRLLDSLERVTEIINRYKKHDVIWLAEKVETVEEFEFCKNAGCSLFQGYFFSKPINVYGERLPDNHTSVLRLLHTLNNDNASIEDIAKVLKTEPIFSYKILKIVNSAAFGMQREISSIQQAIMMIGLNQIRSWSNVIALGRLQDKPDVLREQSVVRAALCQSLSAYFPKLDPETGFTLGLFSLLPAFINKPMAELCKQLNLPHDLSAALTSFKGDYGVVLRTTLAMEKGHWETIDWAYLESLNISPVTLEKLYLHALQETRALLNSVH